MAQNTFVHCSVVSPARVGPDAAATLQHVRRDGQADDVARRARGAPHAEDQPARFSGFTHPDVTATRFGKPSDWTKPFTAHSGRTGASLGSTPRTCPSAGR